MAAKSQEEQLTATGYGNTRAEEPRFAVICPEAPVMLFTEYKKGGKKI